MNAPVQADGFTAACMTCGAPAQITLSAPVPACRYCGAASPLAPRALDRLRGAARKAVEAAGREHLRLLSAQKELETAVVLAVAAVGLTWLILGGVAIYLCVDSITDHTDLVSALTDPEHAKKSLESTWILASMLGSLGIAVSAVLLSIARLRAKVAPPLALPPLSGGAYRCHLCGAALAGTGAIRGCGACGAKNLIDGRVLDQHVSDLVTHIAALEAPVTAAADATGDLIGRVAMWTSLVPLLLGPAVGAIAALVTETWYPALNLVWMASFVPGLFALAYLLLKGRIPVRAFGDTRQGDEIRVDGVSYRVVGLLHLPASTDAAPLPPSPLRLLCPAGSEQPTLAVHVVETADARASAFRMCPGGLPLGDAEALRSAPVISVEAQAGARAEARWLASGEGKSARLFTANAQLQALPTWTLEPMKLKKTDVFVP